MKLVHHACLAVSHVGDYACMYAVHNMFVHCVLSVNLNTHLVYANIQNIVCFIAYTAIVDSTLVLVNIVITCMYFPSKGLLLRRRKAVTTCAARRLVGFTD